MDDNLRGFVGSAAARAYDKAVEVEKKADQNTAQMDNIAPYYTEFSGNQLYDTNTKKLETSIDDNGNEVPSTTYLTSAPIPVFEGMEIFFLINYLQGAYVHRVAFYDSEGNFISKSANWITNIKVPKSATVMAFDVQLSVESQNLMVTYNNKKAYEDYASIVMPLFYFTNRNYFDSIDIVVGKEVNVYYETLFSTKKDNGYYTKVVCDTLSNNSFYELPECIRFETTAGDVGEHNVTVQVYELETDILVGASTFTANVLADSGLISTKKIIFLGDSWIDNQHIQDTLYDDFAGDVELYGTLGTSPYLHEGRSGWSNLTYLEEESYNGFTNAFYNPSTNGFDFSYYITENPSFADVDTVVIHLGINESWWEGLLPRMETIIASIHSYNSDIDIIVCSAPLAPLENGGTAYKMQASGVLRSLQYNGNRFMFKNFLGRENENIYIIADKANLDSAYDYPTESVDVSARNTTKVTRVMDNNHLASYGYEKISDVFYGMLTKLYA